MVLAQIYGSRNYEEAMACAAAGADLIGIVLPQPLEAPTVL